MDRLLELLDRSNTKATFFILGMVAEKIPSLIRRIATSGHEIASHGFFHYTINCMTPISFENDVNKSKKLLEDTVGKKILGYRAAEFSVTKKTLWALEVLAELGFHYDSSIFPIHHRRYGIPDFSRRAERYDLSNGMQIIELPLTTLQWSNVNWPVAGGGILG